MRRVRCLALDVSHTSTRSRFGRGIILLCDCPEIVVRRCSFCIVRLSLLCCVSILYLTVFFLAAFCSDGSPAGTISPVSFPDGKVLSPVFWFCWSTRRWEKVNSPPKKTRDWIQLFGSNSSILLRILQWNLKRNMTVPFKTFNFA